MTKTRYSQDTTLVQEPPAGKCRRAGLNEILPVLLRRRESTSIYGGDHDHLITITIIIMMIITTTTTAIVISTPSHDNKLFNIRFT